MAKAAYWTVTDVEGSKRGEQTGIRYPGSPTLVKRSECLQVSGDEVIRCRRKRINIPPGEYVRKNETQRN